jgi:hypothetical protein
VIRRLLPVALGLFALAACRERTPEVVLPPGHPADPASPATSTALPSSTLALDAPATTPPSPRAETYVCPMHPEVVSHEPGHCPKCGMALKPRPSTP